MNYLSEIQFDTNEDSKPFLSIDSSSKLGYTGYRSRVFATEGSCMFFDMGFSGFHYFWMSQVAFPLDIIFIGEDLRVVDVVEGVPSSEMELTSKDRAMYVVETKHGWCSDNNITEGTKVEFLSMWDRI